MSTHLSRFFQKLRLERKLKPGQVAALAGCINISKNGGRIKEFEETGDISKELFIRLINAFDVDHATVEQLIELDRQEYLEAWTKWVDTPVEPYAVIRWMAAVYQNVKLPKGITLEDAEALVKALAIKRALRCCLVWNRRLTIWFDREGGIEGRTEASPRESNSPYMQIGRGTFLFGHDLRIPIMTELPKKPPIDYKETP